MWNNETLVKILKEDGVAVMPTDTVYGIVGRAESPQVVERIYETRKRNPEKPCIILVGDKKELEKFSIELSTEQQKILDEYWPGSVSIILDCSDDKFEYLHRGTKTLAFRLPQNEELRKLLNATGSLIAPSANSEGLPTARNIEEAKKYFGDLVNFYLDGGELSGKASKIIRLYNDGKVSIIRE